MRSLITVILISGLLGSLNAQRQLAERASSNSIIQENVEDRYSLIKVDLDDIQIIFRKDRLEIYERKSASEELQTFLFFDKCNPVTPTLIDLVDERNSDITNPDFAKFVQSDKITLRSFNQLVYKGLYPDADLFVTANNMGVRFELVDNQGNERTLNLRSWGNDDILTSNGVVGLSRHPRIQLSSNESQIQHTDGKINVLPSTKNNIRKATFEINLK